MLGRDAAGGNDSGARLPERDLLMLGERRDMTAFITANNRPNSSAPGSAGRLRVVAAGTRRAQEGVYPLCHKPYNASICRQVKIRVVCSSKPRTPCVT